jgi:eukaryotic-like serine/threonine-protein kinase
MDSERWKQVDNLLQSVLECPPEGRDAFLRRACAGDQALEREVRSLLISQQQAGSFLDGVAITVAARAMVSQQDSEAMESMDRLTGRTISHYQIIEKLGEGGMGVVYKARDTHLDRFVAIKVLPPEKVADAERKRRFVQEAKSASALNHPNIITIHDIASDNGLDFIAMEYVPGKALNQLIARKRLPLPEALKYAVQIADALAAAHAAGIIHRDLKPANVMVSGAPKRSGLIKVLDFGLAKLTDKGDSSDRGFTESLDDEDTPASGQGTVVGTISYMSPEQAEGKKVDARSDIFSFGALLYEMVTGRRAFQGDSRLSTLSAVLREEPRPASEIVEGLPRELERIIARCLRKSPERRPQTMADLKVGLQELKEESDSGSLDAAPTRRQQPSPRLVWAAALLAALTLGVGTLWFMRSPAKPPEAALNPVPLTTYPGIQARPSFSPDGNQVAFAWNGEKQDNFDIYVKMIGTNGPPLRLTTDAAPDHSPAWSADGRFIAFRRDLPSGKSAVMVIPAIGGLERKVAEIFPEGCPAWSPDGNWLAISDRDSETEPFALSLLSVETGEKRRLTFPPKQSFGDLDPNFSPDGRSLAFSRGIDAHTADLGDLYLLALSQGLNPAGEPRQVTFGSQGAEESAWTADGREIVYSAGFVVPRGLWRIAVSGNAAGRAQPQRLPNVGNNANQPAISRSGHRLAYANWLHHSSIWRMAAPGLEGKRLQPLNPPNLLISSTRDDTGPQFSPDGQKIAFESTRSGSLEVWICDADGSNAVQLTSFGGPDVTTPRWSPDGGRIAFDSNAAGQWDIYVVGANGGKPQRMTTDPANDGTPSWSHDGRWIYFDSARAGAQQVWKMPANGGEAVQVTKDGGYAPLESPDGKFLYYTKALFPTTSLWKIPIEGGEASKVLESLSYYENVAIVGSGLYFVPTLNTAGDSSIQFLSFATNKISNLAEFKKSPVGGLTVSPDGKWILYSLEQQSGSELMLVENFR